MTLDAATLFVASTVIDIVLATYFWALWLGRREQRIHFWIAASATCAAVGCLCYMLRGVAPDWIAVWAAQVCFIQTFAFLWAGVRMVHARPRPPLAIWCGTIIWTIACIIPPLFAAEACRNVFATVSFAAYCVGMSAELLRRAEGRALPSRWLTAALLVVLSTSSLALCAFTATHGDVIAPLASTAHVTALWLLLYTAIYITLLVSVTTLELGNEAQRQREAATTDALTGLLNRRAFIERATDAARDPQGATLLMLDIDHFKQVNDHWGHAAGDRALVLFADALLDTIGTTPRAVTARIGGEEFAVLLPAAVPEEAIALAERIGARVRTLRHSPGAPRLTVSIGVAANVAGERLLDDLLAAADEALYRAKHTGRDRLERETDPTTNVTPLTPLAA